MTPAIAISNLTKYYRKFKAIDALSLEVAPGEFFGFLGPNGAGKTTTIAAMTGLANFQAGQIRVFGHDVQKDYRQARALIGLVPQEFNFDPFLSAEQILTFEGGYFGMTRGEAKERARELLEFFNLWPKRDEGYKRLSGGMKRRLLIARAMVHRPQVLILDEPTAGVDVELRYQLWDFLRQLNGRGTTIFLTTHYIEEAERLCGRVGVIHEGKIVALDTTEALIRKMGRTHVELYLTAVMQALPRELDAAGATLEDGGRRIHFEDKNGGLAEVLRVLYRNGLEIEKLDTHQPTLEDVFLKLTGKKIEVRE
ncbi:MAG: ABC transporter ATP-binding protein [Candidatus Omnitrophota bacterium]|jgi:ABC-2 type transport system ATP-binding protein